MKRVFPGWVGGTNVPKVADFHSVNEAQKPQDARRYHNNSECAPGRDIPQSERRFGTGGYRLCDHCARLA